MSRWDGDRVIARSRVIKVYWNFLCAHYIVHEFTLLVLWMMLLYDLLDLCPQCLYALKHCFIEYKHIVLCIYYWWWRWRKNVYPYLQEYVFVNYMNTAEFAKYILCCMTLYSNSIVLVQHVNICTSMEWSRYLCTELYYSCMHRLIKFLMLLNTR